MGGPIASHDDRQAYMHFETKVSSIPLVSQGIHEFDIFVCSSNNIQELPTFLCFELGLSSYATSLQSLQLTSQSFPTSAHNAPAEAPIHTLHPHHITHTTQKSSHSIARTSTAASDVHIVLNRTTLTCTDWERVRWRILGLPRVCLPAPGHVSKASHLNERWGDDPFNKKSHHKRHVKQH